MWWLPDQKITLSQPRLYLPAAAMAGQMGLAHALACCLAGWAAADSFVALPNTDACTSGGACNIARHLDSSIEELHALCAAEPRCQCHNERWLKSDCSQRKYSAGTILYMKGTGPFPPPPPPLPPPPPSPDLPVTGVARIWPSPLVAHGAGPSVPLSKNLRIFTTSASDTVAHAIERYSQWIVPGPRDLHVHNKFADAESAVSIQSVSLDIVNDSEHLGAHTNYSYTISANDTAVVATCGSPYAAAYALETLAQLLSEGELPFEELFVRDEPQYQHRGLLLDVGRRFYPLPLLHDIIDAISFSKQNVLHLHFSDFPAFRIESKQFPSLTAHLGNQSYSQEEVKLLIEYGRLRGVRLIPEIDVPGHASGMRSLSRPQERAGTGPLLHYCKEDRQKTIYGDPGNESAQVVAQLIAEISGLFPDELFHIGTFLPHQSFRATSIRTCNLTQSWWRS